MSEEKVQDLGDCLVVELPPDAAVVDEQTTLRIEQIVKEKTGRDKVLVVPPGIKVYTVGKYRYWEKVGNIEFSVEFKTREELIAYIEQRVK